MLFSTNACGGGDQEEVHVSIMRGVYVKSGKRGVKERLHSSVSIVILPAVLQAGSLTAPPSFGKCLALVPLHHLCTSPSSLS